MKKSFPLLLITIFLITSCSKKNENNPVHSVTVAPPKIGDSYKGGIVAYILQSGDPGYVNGETHGLIISTVDLSSGISWYNGTFITVNTGTAIGTGSANTAAIIAAQGSGNYAASICKAYNGGGYTDWYLPSIKELYELYYNQSLIGNNIDSGNSETYWSSSMWVGNLSGFPNNSVYILYFYAPLTNQSNVISATSNPSIAVRAVRSF